MQRWSRPRAESIRNWPDWAQYSLALGIVAIAVTLRIPLHPLLADRAPFITLFLVMLPLVLLVRFGPFLVSSLLGMTGVIVYFKDHYLAGGAEAVAELALFFLAAVMATITAWFAQRQQSRQQAADTMLRAFVDESPSCKWITNGRGQIVYANQSMAQALGKTVEGVIGRTHADLLPPRLAQIAADHIRAVRESGEPCTSFEEIEPLGANGDRRILEWRRFLLRAGQNEYALVAGMAYDITERTRIERALRETTEHAHRQFLEIEALYSAAPIGLAMFDMDFRFVRINDALAQINGMPAEAHIGKTVYELLPTIAPTAHEVFRRVIETGQAVRLEVHGSTPGNPDGVWDEHWYPMFNDAGQIVSVGAIVLDVTARQRAEQALRESEQRFSLALTHTPVLVYKTDRELRYEWIYNNPERFAHFDVIGKKDDEILPAEQVAEVMAFKRGVIDSGRPARREIAMAFADRVEYWDVHAEPLCNDGGEATGMIVSALDITDRKRAEQAIRESEARLRSVIDQFPAGVGVMDRTGCWILTNPAMDRYVSTGLHSAPSDRAGRWRFWDDQGELISPEHWPGQRALRGESVPGMEGLYTDDDGREIWMRVSAAPLRNDSSEVIGATAVVLDIDLAKRFSDSLEAELAKRTEEVHRAAKAVAVAQRMAAVGTMASGLAHDMKNVLFPLSVRMDSVLASSELAGEARTDLTVSVALIDHLRQMAKNLEMFARDPEQEGSEGITQLGPWSRRVQSLLESSLEVHGRRTDRLIRLNCNVPDELAAVAIAPHRLTQVVLNLVQNARDAIITKDAGRSAQNGPPGCISVEARATADGSAVELQVIDDGVGMDEEIRRQCMEPFFTTKDRPTSAGLSGSGLGLALVSAIVERVGGHLHVESEIGKGTTIMMVLPIASPERTPGAATPIARASVTIEDKRLRSLVIKTLESLRYEALDGPPEQDSPSVAWITDNTSAKPEHAASFMRLRPRQRVVVLDGDDGWRTAGAIVCNREGIMTTLRQVLAGRPRDQTNPFVRLTSPVE